MQIRRAVNTDAAMIFELHKHDEAFEVSEDVRFYELDELLSWIESPNENIVLVAETSGKLVGFLFCKVMSWHWAALDNFYIAPAFRGSFALIRLMDELRSILSEKGIYYLSTLVRSDDRKLLEICEKYGFKSEHSYVWLDKFLR
ncbi:MAG TPA: GNAT family N-acetyltransferase [Pyrinomonadaceae bacterium]|jgi:ribosomal protein S18 acetylase RimI-like enzyme|nr:GNAT family N-acetyltransferase [Pyrinomonadaceae bacterium]